MKLTAGHVWRGRWTPTVGQVWRSRESARAVVIRHVDPWNRRLTWEAVAATGGRRQGTSDWAGFAQRWALVTGDTE